MKTIEVVCALIKKDNLILCCKRGSGRDLEGYFEFPGGKIEPGETREDAIRREIREELLMEIDVGEFFLTIEHDYESFHLTMHAFFSTIKEGNVHLTEHTDFKWLSIPEMNTLDFAPADRKIVLELKSLQK